MVYGMSDAVIVAFVVKWATVIGFWIWAHKIVTGIVTAIVALVIKGGVQRPEGTGDWGRDRNHF